MAEETRKYIRRPFPGHTLQETLQVPQAIQDQNNGRPMRRVLLASAIGRKPASSEVKHLLSSSAKYGFTIGSEKSAEISLTELGVSITKPRNPAERATAMKRAAMHPELFRRIYDHYDDGKLPQGQFFLSVLERDFAVPRERAEECSDFVTRNGQFVGIIQEVQGSPYVLLQAEAAAEVAQEETASAAEAVLEEHEAGLPPAPPAPEQPPAERYIFIGHGKNRKPLEQLEKVLREFKIPYKVAVEEPQLARAISVKVAETMRQCHSAILIFTADEQFKTDEDEIVWRPSENVIYELGAASVLYENRIVIFKEQGLEFPTNFSEIGHIPFEKDRLDAKGVELIKELIGWKLIKVQPV